jgi:mannose-6-phosphate isomerase
MSAILDIDRAQLPVHVPKPWGYEIWWAWTDEYVGKIIHVNRGHKLSVQYHERKDETSYLQSGRMLLHKGTSLEDLETTEIEVGASWRNRPGEVHTIEALEDADVLEVSTPHLDDVVRLQDGYGREGTNAP